MFQNCCFPEILITEIPRPFQNWILVLSIAYSGLETTLHYYLIFPGFQWLWETLYFNQTINLLCTSHLQHITVKLCFRISQSVPHFKFSWCCKNTDISGFSNFTQVNQSFLIKLKNNLKKSYCVLILSIGLSDEMLKNMIFFVLKDTSLWCLGLPAQLSFRKHCVKSCITSSFIVAWALLQTQANELCKDRIGLNQLFMTWSVG